jgi:hypothetical protein
VDYAASVKGDVFSVNQTIFKRRVQSHSTCSRRQAETSSSSQSAEEHAGSLRLVISYRTFVEGCSLWCDSAILLTEGHGTKTQDEIRRIANYRG